jgi:hypothetical protein
MKKPVLALNQLFDLMPINNVCPEGTSGNPAYRDAI